ncbi:MULTISPECIES: DUF6348 family protein [unclassified Corallococcus]|uniref:DUF6348 family protein n=1 Tax=unclassified Corallococcus TaxID=2685029 RepID=UPI001A8D0E1C|nr:MULTISPECIES: DUF6348 family protein [unclassified Corallococcus]MBN9684635.1 hypothetical protein [Corallococcus sp. NCSPR001]WAS83894.1 DUF6348 family protein [Corallococcus sp. NCRR]
MTQTSANEKLAEILRAHGLPIQEEEEWLRVGPGGPRFQATLIDTRTEPGSCTRQLDVCLEPWTGRWVFESVGGFGTTETEASNDALMNFVRASLHVLLSAFVRPPDEHVTVATWRVGGIDRKVILGNVITRGDHPGPKLEESWFKAFESALRSLPLTSGTHWVRVYYAQMDEKRMALEVLLDNEPWQALADQLETASWPAAPGFLSRRLFLVLQGGVDVSRAVAAWFDVPEDGDPIALLQEQGATRLEAEKLDAYLPLAFGEPVMKKLGAESSRTAEFTANPPIVQRTVVLAEDPLWRDAVHLAEQAFQGNTALTREQLIRLSTSGATVRVLNDFLNQGSDPKDLQFTPPLITLSPKAMAEWLKSEPFVSPPVATPAALAIVTISETPTAPRRPWWKFW